MHSKTNLILKSIKDVYEVTIEDKYLQRGKKINELRQYLSKINPDYIRTLQLDSFFLLGDILGELVDEGCEAFDITLESVIKCDSYSYKHTKSQKEFTTSLSLAPSDKSLTEIIRENIQGETKIRNFKCKEKDCCFATTATSSRTFLSLPKILIVQLEKKAIYPSRNFDIKNVTIEQDLTTKTSYELIGVIFHRGTSRSGHYTR